MAVNKTILELSNRNIRNTNAIILFEMAFKQRTNKLPGFFLDTFQKTFENISSSCLIFQRRCVLVGILNTVIRYMACFIYARIHRIHLMLERKGKDLLLSCVVGNHYWLHLSRRHSSVRLAFVKLRQQNKKDSIKRSTIKTMSNIRARCFRRSFVSSSSSSSSSPGVESRKRWCCQRFKLRDDICAYDAINWRLISNENRTKTKEGLCLDRKRSK